MKRNFGIKLLQKLRSRNSFFILFCLITTVLFAQKKSIVNDSLVANNSFEQTHYFLKKDVFSGDTIKRPIEFEKRFDFFQHNFIDTNLRQNLGIYASASQEQLKPYNDELGNSDGIRVYDYLAFKDEDIKYYDTKVPYSWLQFRQNFNGTLSAEGVYTQSINEEGNIGGRFRRTLSPLNFGSNPNNISYLENTALLLHASYISKSKKYKALVQYNFLDESVNENGGADLRGINTPEARDSLAAEDFVATRISGVEARERRNNFSFYQELSPFRNGEIKLFHNLDRNRKSNRYEDNNVADNFSYYRNIANFADTTTTLDSNVFTNINNKVGINGKVAQVSYAFYLKSRLWKYFDRFFDERDNFRNELYVGGQLGYISKQRDVKANALFEVGGESLSKIQLTGDLKYLKFNFLTLENRAALRFTDLFENHFSTPDNVSFENYRITNLKISPYYNGKKFGVEAFVNLQTYTDYVFYDSTGTPTQDNGSTTGLIYGAKIGYKGRVFSATQFIQLSDNNNDFIRVPDLYLHTNLDYRFTFKWLRSLKTNIGLDAFYTSSYSPYEYNSGLQSFIIQEAFEEEAYLVVDTYLNFEYKTVQASIKVVNILEGVLRNGYYTSPGYFGRERGVEIGLKWIFFR